MPMLFSLPLSAVNTGANDNIAIQWQGVNLTVQVEKSATLSIVLERVCTQTCAQCEGAERAGDGWVGPVTLSGDWNDVVNNLLAGTGLNYIATSELPGTPARLVILGAALTADKPIQSAPNPQVQAAVAPVRAELPGSSPSPASPSVSNPGSAAPTNQPHVPRYIQQQQQGTSGQPPRPFRPAIPENAIE
jgi:hypothetical protein